MPKSAVVVLVAVRTRVRHIVLECNTGVYEIMLPVHATAVVASLILANCPVSMTT